MDIEANARLSFTKAAYSLEPVLNSNYLTQAYEINLLNELPWALNLNNDFTYTINSGRAAGYNTKIPIWNVSLSKSFMKNKRAELKFSITDLLNQNQGITRSTNQNYIDDSRYNVLQRYYLLTFTFSLHKSGRQTNGPGGPGGPPMMMMIRH